MSETVIANDGTLLPVDALAQAFTYSGSNVQTISVIYPNNLGVTKTYTQTFSYSGSNIINISGWISS